MSRKKMTKKMMGFLAAALLAAAVFAPVKAMAAGWSGGTDEDGYRLIATKDDMLTLMKDSSLWGKDAKYRLSADIDLKGAKQNPIGNNSKGKHFQGTFDGNGHTVKNVNIEGSEGYLGLFGYVERATIKDLTIEGSVTSTAKAATGSDKAKTSVGGLVGACLTSVDIENCVNKCAVTAENVKYVGGIVGYVYAVSSKEGLEVTIKGCVNEGKIKGFQETGGIAGYTVTANPKDSSIKNIPIVITECRNKGDVTADSYVGGIIGYAKDNLSGKDQTEISQCLNEGKVTAMVTGEKANANIGGVAGVLWISKVTDCMNTGAVTSSAMRTGGIVGYGYTKDEAEYSVCTSYNSGKVESTAKARKGAVIGSAVKEGLTAESNYYSQGPEDKFGAVSVASADVGKKDKFKELYQSSAWTDTAKGPVLKVFK